MAHRSSLATRRRSGCRCQDRDAISQYSRSLRRGWRSQDSPREREVGLEAELAGVGRFYFAVMEGVPGDERAVEHRLDEELRVEVRRRRVERRPGDALGGFE